MLHWGSTSVRRTLHVLANAYAMFIESVVFATPPFTLNTATSICESSSTYVESIGFEDGFLGVLSGFGWSADLSVGFALEGCFSKSSVLGDVFPLNEEGLVCEFDGGLILDDVFPFKEEGLVCEFGGWLIVLDDAFPFKEEGLGFVSGGLSNLFLFNEGGWFFKSGESILDEVVSFSEEGLVFVSDGWSSVLFPFNGGLVLESDGGSILDDAPSGGLNDVGGSSRDIRGGVLGVGVQVTVSLCDVRACSILYLCLGGCMYMCEKEKREREVSGRVRVICKIQVT